MSTEYRFDEPALNIAQKIMECRATAAAEGWPDVRLKAAIQCLVIEAMKWAARTAAPVAFIDGNISDETMKQLLEELKGADRGRIMVKPAPAVPQWPNDPPATGANYNAGLWSIRNYDAMIEDFRAVPVPAPAAPAMKEVAWRHDDGPLAGTAITRAKSVADSWVSKGWKVTPLYELVGGEGD